MEEGDNRIEYDQGSNTRRTDSEDTPAAGADRRLAVCVALQ